MLALALTGVQLNLNHERHERVYGWKRLGEKLVNAASENVQLLIRGSLGCVGQEGVLNIHGGYPPCRAVRLVMHHIIARVGIVGSPLLCGGVSPALSGPWKQST